MNTSALTRIAAHTTNEMIVPTSPESKESTKLSPPPAILFNAQVIFQLLRYKKYNESYIMV